MQTGVSTMTTSGITPVVVAPKSAQRIGVPREIFPGEKRVATVPEVVEKLIKLGFQVVVESGAGDAANFSDEVYRTAGAEIIEGAANLWAASDIVFKVRAPTPEEVGLMREGQTLISFIWPAQNPELMQQLAARKVTVLAIDSLPRTLSRAQKMDALTSQAGVAGYRAVIEAANAFGPFLQRPDHGRGQGSASQGFHRRCRRRRPGRDRHCCRPGRHRARQRHSCRSGRPGQIPGWRIRESRI